ncbi:MAG: Serine-type D-Ala-D-Ala carboxypeptidase [Streptosporangiaceae bacterium]|jgi:D-alanyl-D-alanine carboxypeptidase (penicillin-binding protein 5/6)|nr:Serine-type D-Ala-D-Ala carboxypeptidase [Streptosporangiaceae bacterium]
MGTVRRATALTAVPLIVALFACSAGGAPPGGTAAEAAQAAQPVGGAQLGGHGVVVNPAPGVKEPPKVDASSYIISDGDTGEILAAKDPHGHYLPASALKTLTSVALIPKLDRNAMIRPTEATVDVEGTKVGMSPALTYRVSDLFKAMLMVSGNDAALALTQAAGGLPRSLALMNTEARRLQAYDTLAGSPNGLDVDLGLSVNTQHTSAYDLSLVMRQGLRMKDFREYVSTVNADWPALPSKKERDKGHRSGGYPIYTHNRLLRPGHSQYPGMIGGKNGYTVAAQQTFVGAARRNGHTIIISLMHSPELWPYATELLDWGFAARGRVRPVGTLVGPVTPVKKKPKQDAGLAPLGRRNAGDLGLISLGAGAAAALVVAGGAAIMLVRRRRRRAADPAGDPVSPAAGPQPGTPAAPSPEQPAAGFDERIEPPTR